MTLSALIRKRSAGNLAAAIHATQPKEGAASVAVAPPNDRQPIPPMTASEESAIRLWLSAIEEHDGNILETAPETPSTAALATPEPVSYGSLPTVPDSDNRRTCAQCRNLASRVCSVAKPGGIVSANRGYKPELERLRRCEGYLPNAADNDPRPGDERWPGLMKKEKNDENY